MISYKKGNLLDVASGHIIQGCNAQGVMGGGLAYQIKNKYPQCYVRYATEYTVNGLPLGSAVQYSVDTDLCIWNAITQKFFGREPDVVYVDYDALEKALVFINKNIRIYDMIRQFSPDVHLPFIGAGLANGDWGKIEPIIANVFTNRSVTIWSLDGKMPDGTDIK